MAGTHYEAARLGSEAGTNLKYHANTIALGDVVLDVCLADCDLPAFQVCLERCRDRLNLGEAYELQEANEYKWVNEIGKLTSSEELGLFWSALRKSCLVLMKTTSKGYRAVSRAHSPFADVGGCMLTLSSS